MIVSDYYYNPSFPGADTGGGGGGGLKPPSSKLVNNIHMYIPSVYVYNTEQY